MKKGRLIYMDNAATRLGNKGIFNVNSPYAQDEKIIFENARRDIGKQLNINPDRIFFTAGGCEANSWALQRCGCKHIITTKIEHPSILNCCKYLERHGYSVIYLDVDEHGLVNPLDLDEALTKQPLAPTLVSIMCVNNELGCIQDLKAIRKVIDKHNAYREKASTETLMDFAEPIYLHSDCVQAITQVDIPVDCLDMMSVSGHKFGNDFGVGFLYSRIPLEPLIFGGSQEQGLRGGTSNSTAVKNMANALKMKTYDDYYKCHIRAMIKYLRERLTNKFDCIINTPEGSQSNILSVSFKGLDAEKLMVFLFNHNVCVSAGSACSTDHKEPSHVLKAIGLADEYINGTIRFSLSEFIGTQHIDDVIDIIEEYVEATNE